MSSAVAMARCPAPLRDLPRTGIAGCVILEGGPPGDNARCQALGGFPLRAEVRISGLSGRLVATARTERGYFAVAVHPGSYVISCGEPAPSPLPRRSIMRAHKEGDGQGWHGRCRSSLHRWILARSDCCSPTVSGAGSTHLAQNLRAPRVVKSARSRRSSAAQVAQNGTAVADARRSRGRPALTGTLTPVRTRIAGSGG